MKPLILVGSGGHCKSCIDVIEQCGTYQIAGILDMPPMVGGSVLGYSIIGTDEAIPELVSKGYVFLITVGQIKSALLRKKIFEQIKASGGTLATVIAPNSYVSKHALVGEGSIVMPYATLNAEVSIGENCIINTAANVEHECRIGNHVHISTHAVVNGGCTIDSETFIGSNAVTVQGISICQQTIIGAGSLVHQSIFSPGIYTGNPLRLI